MSQYFIAIHRDEKGDPSFRSDRSMHRDIDALNDDMIAAGVRRFAGGLQTGEHVRTVRRQADGALVEGRGPYFNGDSFLDGFWILEVADWAEAMAWGKRAAAACRASVEIRPFH